MITLLGATAITLAALQASISAPTDAFRGCLRDAVSKAQSEKIAGDAIEAYLKNACGTQMATLKGAVITFRMKNGMSKKAAADDADMTVDDYVATPADNYKYMTEMDKPKSAAPAATKAATVPIQAAATQPPKP